MMVRDVIVVVAMGASRIRMLRLAAFAFRTLHSHGVVPLSTLRSPQ
jgi:hypothetical protein